MSDSDLGTIFGTVVGVVATLITSMQYTGARMTKYVASAAAIFTLVVGVWAVAVIPAQFTVTNLWKFGLLYVILFMALLLERSARKEEAESKVESSKQEGIEIGRRSTWRDRQQFLTIQRKEKALNAAIEELYRISQDKGEADKIIGILKEAQRDADRKAIEDIAKQIEDSGLLQGAPQTQ